MSKTIHITVPDPGWNEDEFYTSKDICPGDVLVLTCRKQPHRDITHLFAGNQKHVMTVLSVEHVQSSTSVAGPDWPRVRPPLRCSTRSSMLLTTLEHGKTYVW
jgi:hypothetical protein